MPPSACAQLPLDGPLAPPVRGRACSTGRAPPRRPASRRGRSFMLDGYVDVISRERIEGWLIDHDASQQTPTVAIHVDGREVARCRADLPLGNPTAPHATDD